MAPDDARGNIGGFGRVTAKECLDPDTERL